MPDRVYTAQICANGHLITDALEFSSPVSKFCKDCGAITIHECPNCNNPIVGDSSVVGVISSRSTFKFPHYCPQCGEAFPWTVKSLSAAKMLIAESECMSGDESNALVEVLPYLIIDSPMTPVATSRMKRFMGKCGEAVSSSIRDILVDIASETIKKSLGL